MFTHDIVIVGGGGAGLRAAIAAAEISKQVVHRDRSPKSIRCAATRFPPKGEPRRFLREFDNLDLHAKDTIFGADFLADQDAVEAFVNEAPGEVIQLEHWGCPWSRDPDGRVSVRSFGGMTVDRTLFAADKTGFHLLHTLVPDFPQI